MNFAVNVLRGESFGVRVEGLLPPPGLWFGFSASGLGLRGEGLGLRVQGLGLRV